MLLAFVFACREFSAFNYLDVFKDFLIEIKYHLKQNIIIGRRSVLTFLFIEFDK